MELTPADKERVASQAIEALLQGRRVLTAKGYADLSDTGFVKDKNRIFFRNHLGIGDAVFLKYGLKPIPNGQRVDVDKGDAVVTLASDDTSGGSTKDIGFSYVFGSLGAQGYEIKVHKSLLKLYFVYSHSWVS